MRRFVKFMETEVEISRAGGCVCSVEFMFNGPKVFVWDDKIVLGIALMVAYFECI